MNKKLIALISILIVLILIIIVLFINIQNKSTFKKPKFDEFATSNIPNELKYKESVINISDGYSIYIDGIARKEEDNLIINFVSIESNNKVWTLNFRTEIYWTEDFIGIDIYDLPIGN